MGQYRAIPLTKPWKFRKFSCSHAMVVSTNRNILRYDFFSINHITHKTPKLHHIHQTSGCCLSRCFFYTLIQWFWDRIRKNQMGTHQDMVEEVLHSCSVMDEPCWSWSADTVMQSCGHVMNLSKPTSRVQVLQGYETSYPYPYPSPILVKTLRVYSTLVHH